MNLLILLTASCFFGSHQAIIGTTSTTSLFLKSSTLTLYSIQPFSKILPSLTYNNYNIDPTDGNFFVTPHKFNLALSTTIAPGNVGKPDVLQVSCTPFLVGPVNPTVQPIDLKKIPLDYVGTNANGYFTGFRSQFYSGQPSEQETVCYVANYDVITTLRVLADSCLSTSQYLGIWLNQIKCYTQNWFELNGKSLPDSPQR